MPETVEPRDLPDRSNRIDGRRPGRSHSGDNGHRGQAGSDVGLYCRLKSIGTHRIPIVDGDEAHVAEPGNACSLLDR